MQLRRQRAHDDISFTDAQASLAVPSTTPSGRRIVGLFVGKQQRSPKPLVKWLDLAEGVGFEPA